MQDLEIEFSLSHPVGLRFLLPPQLLAWLIRFGLKSSFAIQLPLLPQEAIPGLPVKQASPSLLR